MSTILILTILRSIPYIAVIVISLQKGFLRLFICALIGLALAFVSVFAPHLETLTLVLRTAFPFFLLWHVYDLNSRNK